MRGRKLLGIAATSFLSLGCISGVSCCLESTAQRQALEEKIRQSENFIVTIEGVQIPPQNNCKQFGASLASQYNLSQSSSIGNWWCHVPYIEQAHKAGGKIILVGHSAGTHQGKLIAGKCKSLGIDIGLMIYLDPTYTNLPLASLDKIPSNVKKVLAFYSDDSLLRGRFLQDNDFESKETKYSNYRISQVNHWQVVLDKEVYKIAGQEIRKVLDTKKIVFSQTPYFSS